MMAPKMNCNNLRIQWCTSCETMLKLFGSVFVWHVGFVVSWHSEVMTYLHPLDILVSDCCLTFFSAISGREQVLFDEIMAVVYWPNTLRWTFIVPVYRKNCVWVDMSLHSSTLSWFWANQSLSYSWILGEEATNTNFSLWCDPNRARTHNKPHLRRPR